MLSVSGEDGSLAFGSIAGDNHLNPVRDSANGGRILPIMRLGPFPVWPSS